MYNRKLENFLLQLLDNSFNCTETNISKLLKNNLYFSNYLNWDSDDFQGCYMEVWEGSYIPIELLKEFVQSIELKDTSFTDYVELFYNLLAILPTTIDSISYSYYEGDGSGIFIKKDKIPFVLYKLCTGQNIPKECYTFVITERFLLRQNGTAPLFTIAQLLELHVEVIENFSLSVVSIEKILPINLELLVGSCRTIEEFNAIGVKCAEIFKQFMAQENIDSVQLLTPQDNIGQQLTDKYYKILAASNVEIEYEPEF